MPNLNQTTVLREVIISRVNTDGSVAITNEGVALNNDLDSPGANMVYGTNANGDRGWVAVNSGDGAVTVSSINALKSLVHRTDQVYSIPTGAKSGFFYYDSSDTTTEEDGGMVFVNSDGRRLKRITDGTTVNVTWFGATGDGVTNDYVAIQAAIDYAVANNIKTVYLPQGNYSINSPIIIRKLSGTSYTFVNLDLVGCVNANASVTDQVSKIIPTYSDTFAIGIQNGRSCTIKNLYIVGTYTLPNSKTVKNLLEQDASNWTQSGVRDSRYSPYAGIVVDPFGTSAPSDSGYPGLSSYYKASATGSSAITIEQCHITNFITGVMVTPNHTTQNAENINIYRCRLHYNKIAAAYGQSQTRSCTLKDSNIAYTLNCFDTLNYGKGTGSMPIVDNVVLSTFKNIIITDAQRAVIVLSNVYAEVMWKIGYSSGTKHVLFKNSTFKYAYGNSTASYPKAPDTPLISGGGKIYFDGCDFIKEGDTNWTLNADNCKAVFTNCNFETPYGALDLDNNIVFNDCYVDGQKGLNSGIKSLIPSSFSAAYLCDNGFKSKKSLDTLSFVYHEVEPSKPVASIGSVSITKNDSTATATFNVSDNTIIKVGDAIVATTLPQSFYFLQADGLNSNTDSQNTTVFIGTVSAINGTSVTIKDIPFNLVDGTYSIRAAWSNYYVGNIVGSLTSGSNIITNVYEENASASLVGMRVRTSRYGHLPNGVYVVSQDRTARTITLSGNSTVNQTTAFIYGGYFKREQVINVAPSDNTGMYADYGDVVRVHGRSDINQAWICTTPGIVGNATHTPIFKQITLTA